MLDDLGHPVSVPHPARRVVSLVPSLTEAIASVDATRLVGATDWCTHPSGLDTRRVRGTKNPDIRAIVDLAPDLVIANQEENRSIDVDRLRSSGVQVWVTRIETLDEAFSSLGRLFTEALDWPPPPWLAEAESVWAQVPPEPALRVVVPIWRDPWMVVGARTFTASLLARLGCEVLPSDLGDRYPRADIEQLDRLGADVVLLPDEPYVFTATDGPDAFSATRCTLVSGRMLTWYGPSLLPARTYLERILRG